MHRLVRLALVLPALALPAAASAARSQAGHGSGGTGLELGLGADWLVDPEDGALQLTLAADRALGRNVSVGARVGVLVTTDPTRVGAPVDVRLRIHGHRLYVEGLLGPWFIFNSGDTLRFHGGIGVGLFAGGLSFGLEAGFLDRTGIVGLRVGFQI